MQVRQHHRFTRTCPWAVATGLMPDISRWCGRWKRWLLDRRTDFVICRLADCRDGILRCPDSKIFPGRDEAFFRLCAYPSFCMYVPAYTTSNARWFSTCRIRRAKRSCRRVLQRLRCDKNCVHASSGEPSLRAVSPAFCVHIVLALEMLNISKLAGKRALPLLLQDSSRPDGSVQNGFRWPGYKSIRGV